MIDASNIPPELKQRRQWVCWRFQEKKNEKTGEVQKTKVPFQVNGRTAKTNDATTWCSFDVACAAAASDGFAGIGYVFAKDDPYVGIDLDDCLEADGIVKPWSKPILDSFESTYMEVSPSGTGIKIFAKGALTGSGKKTPMTDQPQADDALELYDHGRYFTVTGQRWNGAPAEIQSLPDAIGAAVALIAERQGRKRKAASSPNNSRSSTTAGDTYGIDPFKFGADERGQLHAASNVDDFLIAVAGKMRYLDHSEASIRSHISMLNSAMCDGDRSDADIDRITQSAMKWEAGAPEADGYERLFKDEPTGNTYFKAKHGDHWRIFQQRGKGYTVLCGLVDSVHKLATVDGTQRGRLVCWTDEHGKPCEAVMPILNLLSWNAAGVDALANRGLYIYPGQLKAVAEMLALFPSSGQVYAANKPGWLMLPDDSIAYVLPGASYGVEGVRLDVAEHYYRAKGTLADWREQIGAKCVGNTRLTLAVSAAFAGPLLHGLGLAGIGLHFISPTSRGKTSLLMAAGSVIGGGNGVMGYVRAWNGTVNSQEVFAASASDSTLIFDELGGANAKEIMKAVYSLINGIGRSRMDKNSEVRPVRVWRIVLMSAGELDAHEFAKTADVQTKGGIDVRLLAVPMPANAHGMFEDLHGASGGKEFADSLKANALAYHGTAFREFVSKLVPSDIPPQAQLVPTSPSMFGLYHHLQSVHQTIKDFETCAGTNASRSRPCVPFVRRHRGGRRTRDRVRHHWLA